MAGLAALAGLLHLLLLDVAGGISEVGRVRPGPVPVPVAVRTLSVELPAAVAIPEERGPQPEPVAVATPVVHKVRPSPVHASAQAPKASARSRAQPREERLPAEPTERGPDPASPPAALAEPSPAFLQASLEPTGSEPPEAAQPGMMKVALAEARVAPTLLAAGEAPPPTYKTLLPGPATLRYELRKGIFRGNGEIRWRPNGKTYALQFEARLAGLTLLSQNSQGELDAHGLAPVRFVDQRARKAARAVNFSRDTGTISFSGSTTRWPLLAGSQDRLSWMIQLGGIVAANPSLAGSGKIAMVLVSSRGEAAVRTAKFAGKENTETAGGSVPTLKFVIDGLSQYDDDFEIWLDPARGYLPARALSRSYTGETEFELLLQRADP